MSSSVLVCIYVYIFRPILNVSDTLRNLFFDLFALLDDIMSYFGGIRLRDLAVLAKGSSDFIIRIFQATVLVLIVVCGLNTIHFRCKSFTR